MINLFWGKKTIFGLFVVFLFINYISGCRYNIAMGENAIYKNSFYPLLISWIFLVRWMKLKLSFLFKIAFLILGISVFFFLIENRAVSEILMIYSLIVFSTTIVISMQSLRNADRMKQE